MTSARHAARSSSTNTPSVTRARAQRNAERDAVPSVSQGSGHKPWLARYGRKQVSEAWPETACSCETARSQHGLSRFFLDAMNPDVSVLGLAHSGLGLSSRKIFSTPCIYPRGVLYIPHLSIKEETP